MILVDNQIKQYGEKILTPFNANNVSNICYDITTDRFCIAEGDERKHIELQPGDSVFVQSVEKLMMPDNMIGRITLRNSRIRMGLSLDAPVYQPGHETKIFFRITNVSRNAVKLDCSKGIASIMFETLDAVPDVKYDGNYQAEFDYKGLGDYKSKFSDDIVEIERKVENVKSIEKSMYGNVLSIMAIFVGIFSLININITMIMHEVNLKALLTLNFSTIGSIGFLLATINTLLPDGKNTKCVWVACVIALFASIAIQFIPVTP